MDRQELTKQFSNCADLGTILPPPGAGGDAHNHAAIAFNWLQVNAQAQFVAVYRLLTAKIFGRQKAEAPVVEGGEPYRGYGFLHLEGQMDGNFAQFIAHIGKRIYGRDINMQETEAPQGRGAVVLQYNPHEMYRTTREVMSDYGLLDDPDISPHLNALYHILDRAGEKGFVPAHSLN